MAWRYVIFAGFMGFVLSWLMKVAKKPRIVYEIYEAAGYGMFVASFFFDRGRIASSTIATVLGVLLITASLLLFGYTAVFLKIKGKSSSGWEHTTQLIHKGIYGWVRHPVYLCAMIAAIGIMLVRLSALSLSLNVPALLCFNMAAVKGDAFNMEKFGESYQIYMQQVPRLNPLRRVTERSRGHGL